MKNVLLRENGVKKFLGFCTRGKERGEASNSNMVKVGIRTVKVLVRTLWMAPNTSFTQLKSYAYALRL